MAKREHWFEASLFQWGLKLGPFRDQYLSNRSSGVCFQSCLKDGPLRSKLEIFLSKSSKKQL